MSVIDSIENQPETDKIERSCRKCGSSKINDQERNPSGVAIFARPSLRRQSPRLFKSRRSGVTMRLGGLIFETFSPEMSSAT